MIPTQNLFLFPGVRCTHLFEPSDIVYLHADSNYTHVYMSDGTQQFFSKTMKQLEAYLPVDFFCRIHRSYVVNKTYINTINTDTIILNNKAIIPISRRKKKSFKQKII